MSTRITIHRLFSVFIILILFIASCAPMEIKPPPRPAKIALVLGAGASRGFAHIGVLKILESNKIPIHMIVGTSAGSFVGSIYAYGFTAFQLQKMSFSIERGDIVDLTIPDNGFVKGEKLEEYINTLLNNTPIEKLRIPFYAVATDIQNAQEVVFGKGNTGTAVRASCSIPGIFRPVKVGDRTYVDGGVVSPVAVDAAKRYGADFVIAVDISSDIGDRPPESTIETILQSVSIMYSKLSSIQLSKADIVIRPKVGYIGSSDFTKKHEAVLEGEKAAIEALPDINNLINRLQQEGRL
ncbi:MAG: patatin-like phospholipase family protein [Nitrospirota bacterium]